MKNVKLEITASVEHSDELRLLGVQLGAYDHRLGVFTNCEASPLALASLESYWGKFFWAVENEIGLLEVPSIERIESKKRKTASGSV